MTAFLDRPIEGDRPCVWIDAACVKARSAGRIVSVAVIVAAGVNGDGRREVLGTDVGPSEAGTFRTAVPRKLARRGLRGFKLVTSDAHEGLKAAVAEGWAPPGSAAARQQWRRVADQLRPNVPKLAGLKDEGEADVLATMTFPPQHRAKPPSTNPLERLNGGIERRTEVVGVFPSEAAVTRLVGAILLERDDEWSVQRARCITLDTITALGDEPLVDPPRAAA